MLPLLNLQSNELLVYKLQCTQNKIKNKLCIKAISYAYFKLDEKATRYAKKNKSNFINVFAMSNR